MPILNITQRFWVLSGLLVLMSATRFHHFGSVSFLPDASLAVFFLAGLYLGEKPAAKTASRFTSTARVLTSPLASIVLLLVAAGTIDYIAIQYGGVSGWCVTPGYVLLIPAYTAMFLGGEWAARCNPFSRYGAVKTTAILVAVVTLAFLISNAGFYFFSERFQEMSGMQYAGRVAGYYWPYLFYTLLYMGIWLVFHAALVKFLPPPHSSLQPR